MERKDITLLKHKLRKCEYVPQTVIIEAIEFLQGEILDAENEAKRLRKMIEGERA